MNPFRLLVTLLPLLVLPVAATAEEGDDIELIRNLNGLNVEIKAHRGAMSVVMLTNRSKEAAHCSVGFSLNGHAPMMHQVVLRKDRKVSLTHPARSDAGKLKVSVSCSKSVRGAAEAPAEPA